MDSTTRPPASTSSDRFGRYRLLKKLGAGGMATVYQAEMQGMGGFSKLVALKIVHPHLAMQPDFSQMFVGEARLGGLLSHPNIVETFDFGEQDGQLYLAMSYVSGPTVEDLLRIHRDHALPLPLDVALQLMVQVCRGLEYAHQATDHGGEPLNMVHRDLKPSNLLVDRHGLVKLADFGVARATSNLMHTQYSGLVKGTTRYMSPEQAWGHRDLDFRSDLFAVGLILYELITLEPVYSGATVEIIARRAQDANVGPQLERLPAHPFRPALKAALERALAEKPSDRHRSAGELARELEGLLARLHQRTDLRDWLESLQGRFASTGEGQSTAEDGEAEVTATLYDPVVSMAPGMSRYEQVRPSVPEAGVKAGAGAVPSWVVAQAGDIDRSLVPPAAEPGMAGRAVEPPGRAGGGRETVDPTRRSTTQERLLGPS
jgi:serine/threonine protein kinase